jgi:predicted N-acetyltransferase YhbS
MSRPASGSSLTESGIFIQPDSPEFDAAIDSLFDQGFGPGRFAKTAERLREGNVERYDLSRVALRDGEIVAAGKVWPIEIGGVPVLFFGPFAVDLDERHHGLGRIIVDSCIEAAVAAGERAMLLVGAASYFEPSGFEIVPMNLLTLPGPVDPKRLQWRALRTGGLEGLSGAVTLPRAARP